VTLPVFFGGSVNVRITTRIAIHESEVLHNTDAVLKEIARFLIPNVDASSKISGLFAS